MIKKFEVPCYVYWVATNLLLEYVQKYASNIDGGDGNKDESDVSSLEEYSDDDNLDDLEL